MSELQRINEIYEALQQTGDELMDAEDKVDNLRKRYTQLQNDLGDTLNGLGLQSVTTTDGKTVGLHKAFYGSTSKERMPDIMKWLRANGYENRAKPKAIPVKPEEINLLPKTFREKVQYEIHHMTLNALIKELVDEDKLDETAKELFNVHQVNTVTIK